MYESAEEAVARLEAKVARIETALADFFGELGNPYVSSMVDIEIAAGRSLNTLNGIDE